MCYNIITEREVHKMNILNYPTRMRNDLYSIQDAIEKGEYLSMVVTEHRSMIWHYHVEVFENNGDFAYDLWFSDIGQLVW